MGDTVRSPATPAAEGPHWEMGGAMMDGGRTVTGLILKKSIAIMENEIFPFGRVTISFYARKDKNRDKIG
ncbi:MAG: hypothetical protein ACETWK_14140 [Candidatus Aminicenantaceae bacterium]